jgi:ribonuclease P protein component
MFEKVKRLPLGKNYPHLKTQRLSFGVLKWGGNQLPHSRFAVLVSKKLDKRAVIRNKNRRILTAIFQALEQYIAPGLDILLIPHTDISETSHQDLYKELREFFETHRKNK